MLAASRAIGFIQSDRTMLAKANCLPVWDRTSLARAFSDEKSSACQPKAPTRLIRMELGDRTFSKLERSILPVVKPWSATSAGPFLVLPLRKPTRPPKAPTKAALHLAALTDFVFETTNRPRTKPAEYSGSFGRDCLDRISL